MLEDAERLIAAWNKRQANRMPMLSRPPSAPRSPPAIGICGYAARRAVALAPLIYGRSTVTVTSLIPVLSCRSCRPNAPFAALVRLARMSVADEMREEHRRQVLGD